ncbi:multidrug efflux pump subunit AcrB [Ancylobacter polymorphus]|uniref:Multidrug efflux pump subunit AcrB n=1 Tax=Ancylobacter polymorphus TaxID=223390 RepID=A0ABU0BGQ6_9HYPH|nr:efflux RND transporter permease subunit [Ancylobacter polymorphus]MDQ0305010.1 multidrug efflux pump subunit AcrB [Ancylobacter polymorphus]
MSSRENAALTFITLKDWSERGPEDSADAISACINAKMAQIKDAQTFALSPPPIQGLIHIHETFTDQVDNTSSSIRRPLSSYDTLG